MANLPDRVEQTTRQRFAQAVNKDGGKELAAARLKCSVMTVSYVISGDREPGLRLAVAIEEVYNIPVEDWVERPASRKIA